MSPSSSSTNSDAVEHTLWLLSVAVLWGVTNPLIKRGSKGIEHIKQDNRLFQFLAELKFLVCKWQHMIPFLINQCGSLLFYYIIAQADISLAVPITNSLTLIVTMVTGKFLGERVDSKWTYVGVAMVSMGVTLCVLSKV